MRFLTILLRVLLFTLAAQAKHDGQTSGDSDGGDDDDDKTSFTPASPPASSQLFTSTSSVFSTSTLTTTPNATPSTSATASSTASSAIPSGALQFTPPANVTMCEPAIFTWEYNSSTSVPVTIMVANERSVSGQSSSSNEAPLVERVISSSVNAQVCVVSWSEADVPPGSYMLVGTDTAHTGVIEAESSLFFVNQGSDSSCLNQTSSTSTSAVPVSESSATSGGSSDTADPTTSSSGSKSMSIGAIVGTIAGILIGVVGLLLVFSLPRLRRHIFLSKPPRRPGGPYMTF